MLQLSASAMIAALAACGGGSSSTTTTTSPTIAISATSGGGQSAAVSTAFSAPLVATVTSNGSPASGVSVTFTAPSSGASGTFASNGTATETDTTNSSGIATSSAFTANAVAGTFAVTATASGATSPASFSLTSTAAVETIAATSGTPQSAPVGAAFSAPLVATVMTGSTLMSGVVVTFTAPSSGASGTFASNGTATETDTTNSSGVATSSAFTANTTAGSYTVTATAPGVASPANFSLTNQIAAGNYVFSLLGADTSGLYSVAGAFTLNSSGTITAGEQDYVNTVNTYTNSITGGSVTFTTDTNLLITLNTGNTSIGNGGTEVLDGTIVSSSKILITDYDATRVSSGELDAQTATLPTSLSGNYVFLASGWDSGKSPTGLAGVLSIGSGGTISTSGSVFDLSAPPTILDPDESFSAGTVTGPDSSGRVVFTLTPSDTSIPEFGFAGYIIDTNDIRLVESSDELGGTTGGDAFAQSASPTFTGSYVFGSVGGDANGELQAAGILTATSGNKVGGDIAFNDSATQSVPGGTAIVSGSYTVDSFGRAILTGITDSTTSPTYTYNLNLYLTGNGKAPVLSLDTTNVLAGLAYTQSTGTLDAASFSGIYALDVAQYVPANVSTFLGQQAGVGPVAADGVSSLAGFLDVNVGGTLKADKALSGTFSASSTNGVLKGTTTDPITSNTDNFTYFQISTSSVIEIETDADQLTLGNFELQ
jgi:hypothetical protein